MASPTSVSPRAHGCEASACWTASNWTSAPCPVASHFCWSLRNTGWNTSCAPAEQAGVTVRTEAAVAGLRQVGDGVRADLDDGSTVDAVYLVGADGVHSPVRSAIGQPFPGRSVIEPIMLADVRLADPPEEA